MKKIILLSALSVTSLSFGQTFSDDFDSYTAGQYMAAQSSGAWTTWSNTPGSTEDVLVSNADSHSGSNSIYLSTSTSTGGPTDLVRNFGVMNTGQFDIDFYIKVESGKAGYFNFQENATIGQAWAMDCFFNDDGTLNMSNQGGLDFNSTYPVNQWFNFKMSINFNTNQWTVLIDNTAIGTFSNPYNQIASIDIYPTDQNSPYSCGYFIDDFEYTYTPYTLPSLNAAINGLSFDEGEISGNDVTPKVVVRNLGTTAITDFTLNATYNGNNINHVVSGVNLASLATTTITMPGTFTLVPGSNPMSVVVSNVNNATDMDSDDDTMEITVNPVIAAMGKMVVGEEGTGTWCQWCPRGAVYMDMMENKYEHFWAGIAVHNNDPMTNSVYDAGMGALISGYPSALVDRMTVIDPSGVEEDFLNRITVTPTAFITNGASWDANSRVLNVSVSANFQSAANSNYKLAVVLTEDDVTGTSSNWSQSNAYAGGNNGVMGGFESLPNPVPASQMVYDHVAREIKPSFTGYANSFPATVNAGETYSITASFILPAGWDETKINIIGMLFNPSGKIDNAGKATIPEAVSNGLATGTDVTAGISELSNIDDAVLVFPNPANDYVNITIQNKTNESATVSILDMTGKVIGIKTFELNNGASQLTVNTSETPAGVYFVQVVMGDQVARKKIIIE